MRTVRAIQRPAVPSIHAEDEPDTTFLQTVENVLEGTASAINRLTSRNRYFSERSPSSSRQSSESDIHGAPSLAVSTASAAGSIETPEALRSPMEIPRSDMTSTSDGAKTAIYSPSSDDGRTTIHAPESTDQAFEDARAINDRRFIQEAQALAEAKAEAEAHPAPAISEECPPSPDDETFIQAQPSASTLASSADQNSMSMNMSSSSFRMPSNASSPPTDGFLDGVIGAGDSMKTSDTIVPTGPSLEEYDEEEFSDDEGLTMPARKR